MGLPPRELTKELLSISRSERGGCVKVGSVPVEWVELLDMRRPRTEEDLQK